MKTVLKSLIVGVAMLAGSTAHAAMQARDLDGNTATAEAWYDTVLDITWLADANYAYTSGYDADGLMIWSDANAWAAQLSFTDGARVYDNWRLPGTKPVDPMAGYQMASSADGSTDTGYNNSTSELGHMFYDTLGNQGEIGYSGEPTGCFTDNNCLDHNGSSSAVPGQPGGAHASLHNLRPTGYWSSTPFNPDNTKAWSFRMDNGYQGVALKNNSFAAWAVSDGDISAVSATSRTFNPAAAVPEPETYALMLAGLGLVAGMARRQRKA